MDEQIKTDIKTVCERAFDDMVANASAEQKACSDAERARFLSEPEFAATELAKLNEDFTNADANGDGKLNIAEFAVFLDNCKARSVAKGHYWNIIESMEDMYNLHNRHSEGDGITMEDFKLSMGYWMEVWSGKMAAAQ